MTPKPAPADRYEEVRARLDRATNATLVLGAKLKIGDEEEPLYEHRVATLSQPLATMFLDLAKKALPEPTDEQQFEAYVPGEGGGAARVYLKAADVDAVETVIGDLQNTNNMASFENDEEFKSRLKYYVVIARGPGKEVTFLFREFSPKKELKQKGILARLHGSAFTEVAGTTFLFDDRYDFVATEDDVFFLTFNAFERIFRDHIRHAFAERAQPALKKVETKIPIKNVDLFRDAVASDPKFAARLFRMEERGVLDQVTMKKILEGNTFLDLRQLEIEKGEKGESVIVFNNHPSARFVLLDIMDELVYRGFITKKPFIVGRRSPG